VFNKREKLLSVFLSNKSLFKMPFFPYFHFFEKRNKKNGVSNNFIF